MSDETTLSAEERLKQINEERKTLKEQVKSDREKRLEEAEKVRVERDEAIEKMNGVLKNISAKIYEYNKLGKVEKMKRNILGEISKEISSAD